MDIMRAIARVGLFTVAGMAANIAQAVPTSKIIGGQVAESGRWPATVALIIADSTTPFEGYFCEGTLIEPNVVLSAAHCFEGLSANKIQAYVGSQQLSGDGQRIDVQQIRIHGNYSNETNDNDIALVLLKTPVTQAALVSLATAQQTATLTADSQLNIMGWGVTVEDANEPSEQLREAIVPFVTDAECAAIYGDEVSSNMFCAGYELGGVDTCLGDSGGPVIASFNGSERQVGIVSWGNGCAQPGFPGVYTKVSNYQTWLDDTIIVNTDGSISFASDDDNDSGGGSMSWWLALFVPLCLRKRFFKQTKG